MELKKDFSYKNLSNETKNRIYNCKKNCNKKDIFDTLFMVFLGAKDRNEIGGDDIFRMVAKTLNDFYIYKLDNL